MVDVFHLTVHPLLLIAVMMNWIENFFLLIIVRSGEAGVNVLRNETELLLLASGKA